MRGGVRISEEVECWNGCSVCFPAVNRIIMSIVSHAHRPSLQFRANATATIVCRSINNESKRDCLFICCLSHCLFLFLCFSCCCCCWISAAVPAGLHQIVICCPGCAYKITDKDVAHPHTHTHTNIDTYIHAYIQLEAGAQLMWKMCAASGNVRA